MSNGLAASLYYAVCGYIFKLRVLPIVICTHAALHPISNNSFNPSPPPKKKAIRRLFLLSPLNTFSYVHMYSVHILSQIYHGEERLADLRTNCLRSTSFANQR